MTITSETCQTAKTRNEKHAVTATSGNGPPVGTGFVSIGIELGAVGAVKVGGASGLRTQAQAAVRARDITG